MSNDNNQVSAIHGLVLKALVEAADRFHDNDIPGGCTDEDGNVSGHWSGTKDSIEAVLGRRLDPAETTLLSLSRCFGPLPLIEGEWDNPTWKPVFRALWPEGNGSGLYIGWADLGYWIANYGEEAGIPTWALEELLRQRLGG